MTELNLEAIIENQATADGRIPLLLRMPATVRFESCEPSTLRLGSQMTKSLCDILTQLEIDGLPVSTGG